MNKFLFFLFFLAVSLAYIFELDKMIARNLNPFESIKKWYVDISLDIQQSSEKYFGQVKTIEILRAKNKELENYQILYESAKNRLDSTLESLQNIDKSSEKITFSKVLSYVDFNDFTKVWLDFDKKDDQILALISDNYAAGIVVNQAGRSKALLNGNEKSNYTVFIGRNKAPGIIHSSKADGYILAKFVPIWVKIKKGDEVITSGMDNIFFEGLEVGRVVSIRKKQDMQEAIIKPYAKVFKQRSFFVYKKTIDKNKKKTELLKEEIPTK